MIYPRFIKPGDIIGVTAPSDGNKKEIDFIRLESAKKHLKDIGYDVVETCNVRTSKQGKSSSGEQRAKELMELVSQEEISCIVAAKGGDYLVEMLSHLDLEMIKHRPVWYQGYSDVTGLTFMITTNLDIATIYGCNFNDFGMQDWHRSLTENLQILEGKEVLQESFDLHEDDFYDRVTGLEGYTLVKPVVWKLLKQSNLDRMIAEKSKDTESTTNTDSVDMSNETTSTTDIGSDKVSTNKASANDISSNETSTEQVTDEKVELKGRVLCGCFDVLLNLIGTRFDKTKEFVEKYQNDGILWLLESFDLSSEAMLRGLWQLKEAGWFKGAKGFVFGRPAMTRTYTNTTYEEAIWNALGELNVPIILDADLGHRSPQMTVINGSIGEIQYQNGQGSMKFICK